jgi:hypothetical protein
MDYAYITKGGDAHESMPKWGVSPLRQCYISPDSGTQSFKNLRPYLCTRVTRGVADSRPA